MRRVLVLEDDDDLRGLLCELLQLSAPEVHTVCVGSYAELLRRRDEALDCGLALLDVNLGAGVPSGLDAYRWLREHGFGGRTVFLTGHAHSHPLVREAYELTHVRVLSKPVDSDVLLALTQDAPHGPAAP